MSQHLTTLKIFQRVFFFSPCSDTSPRSRFRVQYGGTAQHLPAYAWGCRDLLCSRRCVWRCAVPQSRLGTPGSSLPPAPRGRHVPGWDAALFQKPSPRRGRPGPENAGESIGDRNCPEEGFGTVWLTPPAETRPQGTPTAPSSVPGLGALGVTLPPRDHKAAALTNFQQILFFFIFLNSQASWSCLFVRGSAAYSQARSQVLAKRCHPSRS